MILPYNKDRKILNTSLFIIGILLFAGLLIYCFHVKEDILYKEGRSFYEKSKFQEAYKCFLEAAVQGNAGAQTDLGYLYEMGLGTRKNIDEALYWYHEAAIRGSSRAKSNYACLLEKQDKYYEAFTWLEEAAREGYVQAKLRLGCLYIMGKGVDKNIKKGYEIIREAAEGGSPGAQHLMGVYNQFGLNIPDGSGVKINLEEAEKWYNKAIKQNYILSKSALALLWAEKGINLDEAKNIAEEAVRKYPQVGSCSDALGWVLFKQGNYKEAVIQLEKASSLSLKDPIVLDHLAETYLKLHDEDRAKEQWRKAIELNPSGNLKEKIKAKLDVLENASTK